MDFFGLTEERYNQMMNAWNNDKETVKEIVDEWGIEKCNNGYAIFDYDNDGVLQIQKIDDVGCFENDIEAAIQARKDGVKLIPVSELPLGITGEERLIGWIDTPENREILNRRYTADMLLEVC